MNIMQNQYHAYRLVVLFLSYSILLGGCAILGSPSIESKAYVDSNLTLTLQMDQKEGTVGKPVHISFKVSNSGRVNTGKPEILELNNKSVMDIRVNYATKEFARWTSQNSANYFITHLELDPGESHTIEMIWIPDESARYLDVNVQGLLYWSGNRVAEVTLILPIDYLQVR